MANLKDTCAIVGVGETQYGTLPGMTDAALTFEACKKAVEDAGLTNKDIDGLVAQAPYHGTVMWYSTWMGEKMGLKLKYTTDISLGGASPVAMVQHAVMAINAGLATNVLCVYGESSRSWRPKQPLGTISGPGTVRGRMWGMGQGEFEHPFGYLAPMHAYALAARRHMYEFGTTNKQLGAIAIACRKHASMNDNAQQKKPITMDDYMASPMFCEPFRLLDICQVTDGGAAVLVTSSERAKSLKHKPVYVSGMGNRHPHLGIGWAPSLTTLGGKESSEMAFKMAGMKPKDVDVAEIYDCFTYTVLVTLEDYGFCKKGEGGPFVENGRIEIGGELPVNTHGGLLSQGHIDGMNHVAEAVKQLRGDCGIRQVKDAEIAAVSGNGGMFSTHTTIILRR
jgi:acetyl-CoA acetyltransferase